MMTAERQVQRAAEEVSARAAALAALQDEASAQYTASLGEQALKTARELVRDPNVSALSAERSSFLSDGETVSVVLDYRYQIPVPLFRLPPLSCSCTATRRAWIGETDPENRLSETAADELVYIGKNSTRYHKSAHCHYLSNALSALSVEAAKNARNAGGGRYHAWPGRAGAGGPADLFHDLDVFQDALGLGVDDADQERDTAVDDAHGFTLDLCTTLGRREGDLTGGAGDEQTVEAGLDHAVDVAFERRDVEFAVLERDGQGRDNATDCRRHT